jgi:hypothetical protein
MPDETARMRAARAAAEQGLVRVVHHYGSRPEFVLLGGLIPELLCSASRYQHAGTTDIDVQVDLEIACGSVHTKRLETALKNAEFSPDPERVWRWRSGGIAPRTVVKFELLADLDDQPAEVTVLFDGCDHLGAVNLRGTGYASRDIETRRISARIGGLDHVVDVNVAGLAGFLLAKCAAARVRRLAKDWYDLAFVLLHNDAGGPEAAADAVLERFGSQANSAVRSALDDLVANFSDHRSQGPGAYAAQMRIDHPDLGAAELRAEAIVAVETFHRIVTDD